MKVLICCVNYNSYKELDEYIESVENSAKQATNTSIRVIIADNSTIFHEYKKKSTKILQIEQIHFNNLGYLGAAQNIINNVYDIQQFNYVIISNVDILMNVNFFRLLETYQLDNDIAWIAPSIRSLLIGRDKNPSVMFRYPKWKLRTLKLTYNKFILPLYEKFYYNKKQHNIQYGEKDIYAGHGSFFLLTRNFFNVYKQLNYPIFLYGEELYFAELIRLAKLRVRYVPSLLINDIEHISTSLIKRDIYYHYNRMAIDYIIKRFY